MMNTLDEDYARFYYRSVLQKNVIEGRHKNLNFTTKTLVHVSGFVPTDTHIISSAFRPVLFTDYRAWCCSLGICLLTRLKLVNSKDKVHLDKVGVK